MTETGGETVITIETASARAFVEAGWLREGDLSWSIETPDEPSVPTVALRTLAAAAVGMMRGGAISAVEAIDAGWETSTAFAGLARRIADLSADEVEVWLRAIDREVG